MSFYAVVSGAGSGTGASVARRFAKAYPVVLLARRAATYQSTVDEINASGGKAFGLEADAADPAAMDAAFARISKELLPGHQLAAAVYNAGGGMSVKPFLELELKLFEQSLDIQAKGLFLFAKATLPQLLSSVGKSPHPPSLIVSSATAALRGSRYFGGFAAGKFAARALTQSLAREFGPQGIHVATAILDGSIDTPWGKDRVANGGAEDGKISPDEIAESYWYLHTQHRSAFTLELDIRPYIEKF